MIVVVTGLMREARIAAGNGVRAISCGGRRDVLTREVTRALDSTVRGIISFGICAGLSPTLVAGTSVIATGIATADDAIPVDAAWRARLARLLPHAVRGAIAGSDFLLRSADQKKALFAHTGAVAADMESHVAAEIARRHNLPFACVRTIADPCDRDLPAAAGVAIRENGSVDVGAVVASLIRRPGQMRTLIQAARDSQAGFAALLRCRNLLGDRLAGPDFGEPLLDMR